MEISAKLVKELRDRTNAGILDCKKALSETKGNIEEAIKWLRETGITKAAKKAGRIAAEGLIGIKSNKNELVICEINSETDFVSKNADMLKLVEDITTILLNNNFKNVDEALNEKFKGKVNQEGKTIKEILSYNISIIGENISLRRFEKIENVNKGILTSYLHSDSSVGTIISFDNNVDETIARQIAMHITAMKPAFISKSDLSAEYVEKERSMIENELLNDAANAKKPKEILAKIIEGRLSKELSQNTLLEQPFVVDPSVKVGELLKDKKQI